MTTMAPDLAAWPQTSHVHSLAWPDHTLQYPSHAAIMQTYIQPVRTPSISNVPTPTPRESMSRPGQSTPWTMQEDNLLMDGKARGLSWEEIHKQYFPTKSANACRKRHERAIAKARDTDWNEARIQKVIEEYNRSREQFWRKLSEVVGERWEEVEKLVGFQ